MTDKTIELAIEIPACFEPAHYLLGACYQPVLERKELLPNSIKPRKRRIEIAEASNLTLES